MYYIRKTVKPIKISIILEYLKSIFHHYIGSDHHRLLTFDGKHIFNIVFNVFIVRKLRVKMFVFKMFSILDEPNFLSIS